MSADLQAYLCEFSPRPFVRGVSDCCAFAAGWMERVSGRPVVCPHLGEELTDREAVAIVARIGGIAAAARAALRDAGWRQRVGDPQDGDIIIANHSTDIFSTYLGVCSGGRLVSASRRGMRILSLPELVELEIWSWPQELP